MAEIGRRRRLSRRDEHRSDDDGEKRRAFDGGRQLLEAAADAQPGQLQRHQRRERENRDRLLEAGQRWREQHGVLADRNRDVAEHGAVGDPVRPADGEAGGVAERAARVDVEAARLRQHRSQLGDADRADQRIEATEDPDRENRGHARQLSGDEAGRAEDADAERAADDHGEAEADAEDADEPARSGTRSGPVQHADADGSCDERAPCYIE